MIRAAWSWVTASVTSSVPVALLSDASWVPEELEELDLEVELGATEVSPTPRTTTSGTSTRVARTYRCWSAMWSPAGVSPGLLADVERVEDRDVRAHGQELPDVRGVVEGDRDRHLPGRTRIWPLTAAWAPKTELSTTSPGTRSVVATSWSVPVTLVIAPSGTPLLATSSLTIRPLLTASCTVVPARTSLRTM